MVTGHVNSAKQRMHHYNRYIEVLYTSIKNIANNHFDLNSSGFYNGVSRMLWVSKETLFALVFSDGMNTILSNIKRIQTLFLNVQQTRTCSSIDNQTWTLYFWLWPIEYQTLNPAGPITRFNKLLIEQTPTSILRTLKEFERVYLLVIEVRTQTYYFLAANERTLNIVWPITTY